ncbi:hypothetical protein GCM10010912_52150 [Paenibacillus albidus]|uniref:Sporulation protein YjcZ n=1 Tax=Paenibacillus albidus TaxID=2041023 RepID=A0A917CVX3_9BACL|nr:hypothetical protein GCM10010912_52150 [Paenibacillus albidus]
MSGVVGGYGCDHEKKCISPFTSTGAILVLYILLVIILKSCIW